MKKVVTGLCQFKFVTYIERLPHFLDQNLLFSFGWQIHYRDRHVIDCWINDLQSDEGTCTGD